jgi:hypothetical protein
VDFFPNVCNCTQFYRCNHGVHLLQSCPSGLHWNSKFNTCDWPQNVDCFTQTCQSADSSKSIYLPNLNDCHFFYQCHNGILYCMECPPGLHFNTKLNVCDYPTSAGCFNRKSPTFQTQVP